MTGADTLSADAQPNTLLSCERSARPTAPSKFRTQRHRRIRPPRPSQTSRAPRGRGSGSAPQRRTAARCSPAHAAESGPWEASWGVRGVSVGVSVWCPPGDVRGSPGARLHGRDVHEADVSGPGHLEAAQPALDLAQAHAAGGPRRGLGTLVTRGEQRPGRGTATNTAISCPRRPGGCPGGGAPADRVEEVGGLAEVLAEVVWARGWAGVRGEAAAQLRRAWWPLWSGRAQGGRAAAAGERDERAGGELEEERGDLYVVEGQGLRGAEGRGAGTSETGKRTRPRSPLSRGFCARREAEVGGGRAPGTGPHLPSPL